MNNSPQMYEDMELLVDTARRCLTPRQNILFYLYLSGYKVIYIAEKMDITKQAASMAIKVIIGKIHRCLQENHMTDMNSINWHILAKNGSNLPEKKCIGCGNAFHPVKDSQKWCTHLCKLRTRKRCYA